MKLIYPAIFTPFEEAEGYTVVIPDLPGCVTEGHDLTNATEMAIDAAGGWVLDELENSHAVPDSSSPASITVPEGSFMNMITLNIPEQFSFIRIITYSCIDIRIRTYYNIITIRRR